MLDSQLVQVDYTNGVDKKSPDELSVPTRLLTLDDALFDLSGNLNARGGYARQLIAGFNTTSPHGPAAGENETPTAIQRVSAHKNSLIIEDRAKGFFRAHAQGTVQLRASGSLDQVSLVDSFRTGYRAAASLGWVGGSHSDSQYENLTNFTFALGTGGWRYFAWQEGHSIGYRVEGPDGAALHDGRIVGATDGSTYAHKPRFVFCSTTGRAFLYYAAFNGANYCIWVKRFNQTTGAVELDGSGDAQVTDLNNATGTFDVHCAGAVVALGFYGNTMAGDRLTQLVLDPTDGVTAQASQVIATTGEPQNLCALAGIDAGRVYLFWHAGTNVVYGCFMGIAGAGPSGELTAGTGLSSHAASIGRITAINLGSELKVVYENTAEDEVLPTNDALEVRCSTTDADLSITKEDTLFGGFGIQGRLLYADGRVLLPVLFRDLVNPGMFVVDISWHVTRGDIVPANTWVSPHVVARVEWGEAKDLSDGPLPEMQRPSADKVEFVLSRWAPTLAITSGENTTPRRLMRVSLDMRGALGSIENSDVLYLAGACPHVYDGGRVVEENFNTPPVIRNVSLDGAAGDPTWVAGAYSFVAVYEWTDEQGNRWQSAPSQPVPATSTVENTAELVVATLRSTRKAGVRIALYRTNVNGDVYYRFATIANDPAKHNIDVPGIPLDNGSGPKLLDGNELLYTTGGRLEAIPMPPCRQFAVHQRRIWVTGGSSDQEFWYSDQPAEKFIPAFSDALRFSVPSNWGRLIGTAPVDDKVILVAEDIIGTVFGDGPSADGSQNGYSEPSPVIQSAHVKWGTGNAISTTDEGVWFQTERGLRLLSRGMTFAVQQGEGELGASVDPYLVGANVVAVLHPPSEQHIYFFTDVHTCLVYDDYFKQWSRFTGIDGDTSACLAYEPGTTTRKMFFASGGTHLNRGWDEAADPAGAVVPVAESAWFKMAGIQGFQRVQRLGVLGAGAAVNVYLGVDYNPAYTDQFLAAMGPTVTNCRVQPTVQKCESMRIKLTAFSTLRSLALRVGVKRGMVKLASTKYAAGNNN
jgi:hypothetical protein